LKAGGLPQNFVAQRTANRALFPRGVDLLLVSGGSLAALPRTGDFECSNKLVNQLFKNIIWGQRGNHLDIPTDCPQRDERAGWTGDTQIFAPTAAFNADVAAFFLDQGVTCCVLTLGAEGAYWHHRDGTRFHVPAFAVDVKCTCGCGDAFNAGLWIPAA
jgi:hypothetical protein